MVLNRENYQFGLRVPEKLILQHCIYYMTRIIYVQKFPLSTIKLQQLYIIILIFFTYPSALVLVGKKSSIFRNTMCTIGSARPEIHNGKKNEVVIINYYTLNSALFLINILSMLLVSAIIAMASAGMVICATLLYVVKLTNS